MRKSINVSRLIPSIALVVFLGLLASQRWETAAQVRPVYDRGATGLIQAIKRLNTAASVLMIGAHPDDEDTALLAYLARGENARTAYLSLTRGDGGQNIIGPELGESLGVIRTEELLQARRLDGAEQFFTRAYDYGFSKTLTEAKSKWNENEVLCDAVRVIRDFRPIAVVSQFSGTPADGHGQHQFAGYISPMAVKAAADPTQCSESGPPWKASKFYLRHRGAGDPRLRINTGNYDPILGRSYFEIAMEARSQHKSQEQGVLELKGDQFSGLNLVGGTEPETQIFGGIDTSVKNIAGLTGNEEARFVEFSAKLHETSAKARSGLDSNEPHKSIPVLVEGYKLAYDAEWSTRNPSSKAFMKRKQAEYADAIKLAAGIQIDAIADRETIVPGETTYVGVRIFFASRDAVKGRAIDLNTPVGWTVTKAEPPAVPQQQTFFRRETGDFSAYYNVTVASNEMPTQPYWLKNTRKGDVFDWSSAGDAKTLPFERTTPRAVVKLDVFGTTIEFEQPVEFRFADDIRGEVRRNLDVVPNISVELDQPLLIVPYSEKAQMRRITMSVANYSAKPVTGTVSLNINPPDWKFKASATTFDLKRIGEKASITYDVVIPAKTKPGVYQINAQAMIGEALATSTVRTIAYPHIQTHRYYRRATTEVRLFDLKTAPVKIGYILGSGDRVPEAIKQMGFDIETITESELAIGNLSKYDTIVVGIRAYQVRPDVVANNKRLLDFASKGGTLVVQYQLPAYAQQNLGPFPMQMGPRVADENAAVTIVQPGHPILNFPNKISDADFANWVQERNLYNFSTMDAKYIGLLESHDTGEAENRGGLVVADVGKGNYVYCSYSMFRQLPAGVSGAYRLFANILSIPRSGK